MERIAASERTREKLKRLIDGVSGSEDSGSELVRLAARLIVEEALEGEARDAVGRDYYARGAAAGAGYRNGYRTARLKTAEGAAKVTDADEDAWRVDLPGQHPPPPLSSWLIGRNGCARCRSKRISYPVIDVATARI